MSFLLFYIRNEKRRDVIILMTTCAASTVFDIPDPRLANPAVSVSLLQTIENLLDEIAKLNERIAMLEGTTDVK